MLIVFGAISARAWLARGSTRGKARVERSAIEAAAPLRRLTTAAAVACDTLAHVDSQVAGWVLDEGFYIILSYTR